MSDFTPGDRQPGARPTPVRALMNREIQEPPEESEDGAVRNFEWEGVTWRVEVGGATRTGTGSDRGAPLLHLHFRRVDSELPWAECLTIGTTLDELNDDALVELVRRARPMDRTGPGSS